MADMGDGGVAGSLPVPGSAPDFEARVAAEQLRLVTTQVGRLPVVLLLINAFVAWLVARAGWPGVAIAWYVVAALVELWRFNQCRLEQRAPSIDAAPRLLVLSRAFVLASLLRTVLVPFVFAQPQVDLQVMLTMVYVGLAAGGVATVGGVFWAYATWALLVGGALATGWMLRGGPDDIAVGLLVALMFATLALFARDAGRTLRKLVQLAHDNQSLVASLRVERDRAESASQSKTRFFAAASHDLRQPLHALSINATALELVAQAQGQPLVQELSQSIGRALRQSNELLDTLLDISQLDAQVVETHMAPLETCDLLARMHDEFAPTAAQRHLGFELDLPPGEVWVRTDARQLRRLLGNLISNALKFTREGGIVLELRAPAAGAAHATIAVVDTGPGIAGDEQERVFEDFYQIGNPARDRSHGLGLGLSIVRRTAALLGVHVRLRSVPGQGCRFEVEVPYDEAVVAEAGQPAHDAASTDGTPCPRLDLRVLAIDDEADILASLAALLPHFGCEVRCALDLDAATAVLDAGFAPQLLLVDHRLKGLSGTQAIATLRARIGPVPAVIVTGDTSPQDLLSALGGGTRVVHKPLDGRLLARAMAEAVG